MCRNEDMQALLPAYREGSLDSAARGRVEEHLASCADCAEELALLRELAAEPVPDPGEAFWLALPDRVARELRRTEERPERRTLKGLLAGLLLPRWGWAAAAVLIAALAAWYTAAPKLGGPAATTAKRGAQPQVLVVEEPAGLSGVHPRDVGGLSAWAHRELLAAQKELQEPLLPGPGIENGLEDDIANLDQQQFEELVRKLKAHGQEG